MTETRHIGKYEILEEIGRGGFAVVYKAHDAELERLVALKVLHPYWSEDPNFAARFRREARGAANLRHPNIITIHDAGEAEGHLYIAMDYLPGRTLRSLLQAEGALALERALPILEQIAKALDYAHGRGVIHRDVKPNNIMLEEEGQVHVTLMDFGLIKAIESGEGLTSMGTVLGSPEYMAPEQADLDRKDEIGPATDCYALSVVAYEMLTGRVPFPGNTPSTLVAHMQKAPPDPHTIRTSMPASVALVLLKALSKAPGDRYPSAAALVDALRQTEAEGEAVRAARPEPQAETQRIAGREAVRATRPEPQEKTQVETVTPPLAKSPPPEGGSGGQAGEGGQAVGELAREVGTKPAGRVPKRPLPGYAWIALGVVGLVAAGIVIALIVSRQQPPPTGATEIHPTDTTLIRPADASEMVLVPAGEFFMGSADNDLNAADDEKPLHTVYLDAFWIDRTEVTNARYNLCVAAGKCQESYASEAFHGADQPVVDINWDEAMSYCQWAGGSLPTEAQWEKAARGTLSQSSSRAGRTYPWGNRPATCEYAVMNDGSGDGCGRGEITWPVGSKPKGAGPYGALDMAGNVWEWVADWYGPYSPEQQANPTGPAAGTDRVIRGGSYTGTEADLRAAIRHPFSPDGRSQEKGFRCVVVR